MDSFGEIGIGRNVGDLAVIVPVCYRVRRGRQ